MSTSVLAIGRERVCVWRGPLGGDRGAELAHWDHEPGRVRSPTDPDVSSRRIGVEWKQDRAMRDGTARAPQDGNSFRSALLVDHEPAWRLVTEALAIGREFSPYVCPKQHPLNGCATASLTSTHWLETQIPS
jgi:hypothetical protein